MGAERVGAGVSIIICAPQGFTYRSIHRCPYCERRTRHVTTRYEWYDSEVECGGCGHQWSGGYRLRQSNKQRALNRHEFQQRWTEAGTRAGLRAWEAAILDAMQTVSA